MASSRRQLSSCPVCNRADQVKRMQTAYTAGEHPFAPPPLPESHAHMLQYILSAVFLVGAGSFLALVILASNNFSWIEMIVTLLVIAFALVLSFLAIRHINQSDEETRLRYPIWDEAMANWNRLRYCARDKAVFDPQTNKVLTDSSVKALLSMDEINAQHAHEASGVAVH
jgi:Ca2+/Na+ antiporter